MRQIFIALLALGLLLIRDSVLAHPGSGIVVDHQGNVYFVDTGSGVASDGSVTTIATVVR